MALTLRYPPNWSNVKLGPGSTTNKHHILECFFFQMVLVAVKLRKVDSAILFRIRKSCLVVSSKLWCTHNGRFVVEALVSLPLMGRNTWVGPSGHGLLHAKILDEVWKNFPVCLGRFIVVMKGDGLEEGINLGDPGNRIVQGHLWLPLQCLE
jgi:hypothetical protein